MGDTRQTGDIVAQIAELPLVELLNRSVQLEYRFIVNYPRLIEYILRIEGVARRNDEAVEMLKRLTVDSIQHADWTMRLVRQLGGDPLLQFEVFESLIDWRATLRQQLERERIALLLYQRAKGLALRRASKGLWARLKGRLASFLLGPQTRGPADEQVVDLLDKLEAAEEEHVAMVQKVLIALNVS